MTDREHAHDLKPSAGSVCALAATGAVALIVGFAAVAIPRPAGALPSYAQQTGLACGRCHVSPAGGGPRTAFGNAFAANGHKVPAKPAKTGAGRSALVRGDGLSGAGSSSRYWRRRLLFIDRQPALRLYAGTGLFERRLLQDLSAQRLTAPLSAGPRSTERTEEISCSRPYLPRRWHLWVSCFWLLPRFSA